MRKKTQRPKRITNKQLPTGVWWQAYGNGAWMIKQKNLDTGAYKSRKLCHPAATLAEIWQAYNALNPAAKQTFKTISLAYQASRKFSGLSALTKKDYIHCHNKICTFSVKDGLLCDYNIALWTPATVAKYRDAREEESASRAWKEVAYIKTVFAWAVEYDYATTNPARDTSKPKLTPRQHYATDNDFEFLLSIAKHHAPWYMPFAMEIAYQCRMRLSEVAELTDAHETPQGLHISRKKGSKDNIVAWTPELKKLWQDAKNTRDAILKSKSIHPAIDPKKRRIIISERTGDPLTTYGIKVAKARIDAIAKAEAINQGIEYNHFSFHDIKRKAISDFDGSSAEKLDASGHKSASMLNTYDVSIKIVKPTK